MKIDALRRKFPTSYTVCKLDLQGETPLLMSNADSDRESDEYKAFRSLSIERGKTETQLAQLRRLEWNERIWFDAEIGPFVPGKCVKAALEKAGGKWKKGATINHSLVVPEYRIPLDYSGPRDLDGLWDEDYRYTTLVVMAGPSRARVERCRPMFADWSLSCVFAYDPEELDYPLIESVVARTQKFGLADGRNIGFGAFTAAVEVVEGWEGFPELNGHKKVDEVERDALAKRAERIRNVG